MNSADQPSAATATAAGPAWQSITAPAPARASLAPPADERVARLRDWLAAQDPALGLRPDTLRVASADASFRRYFRLDAGLAGHPTLVAMDAPPPQEDVRPFLHAQAVLAEAPVDVPKVLAGDVGHGFLLLSDFGDLTCLEALRADGEATAAGTVGNPGHHATAPGPRTNRLYLGAIDALVRMQAASIGDAPAATAFPPYDRELLLRELALYPDWYVARHKGVTLSDDERKALRTGFERLVDAVLAQPCVTVHRDWHSRNLMVREGTDDPGVLDFQDAVHGPITYDLVSLLRDAYVAWDDEQVLDWAVRYWERARRSGLPVDPDFGAFWRDFEWMGIQRHLKVLGIFARLSHRDGKDRYLADLPRVLRYVTEAVHRYDALAPLARVIDRVESIALESGYTF